MGPLETGGDNPVGKRFGEFVVAAPLAVGGMAEVFLAGRATPEGDEVCAIKRLLPHLTWETEFVRMFMDEVRIASGLVHPNIARVHAYGTAEGGHYLAMEYVHGRDLRNILRATKDQIAPLSFGIGVAVELADALDYAHKYVSPDFEVRGLVHRDVSRSNVMVTFDGKVKLLDFGIARATGRTQYTRAGTFKGKIGYMAPEQCRGEVVDARTDVFSAGVLLYETTTGRRAFFADNDFAVLGKIMAGEYMAPTTFLPDFPPALEAVIQRALAVDPADRFEDARAFGAALRAVADSLSLDLSATARAVQMQQLFGHVPAPQVDVDKLLKLGRDAKPRRLLSIVAVATLTAVVGGVGFAFGSVATEAQESARQEPTAANAAVQQPSAGDGVAADANVAAASPKRAAGALADSRRPDPAALDANAAGDVASDAANDAANDLEDDPTPAVAGESGASEVAAGASTGGDEPGAGDLDGDSTGVAVPGSGEDADAARKAAAKRKKRRRQRNKKRKKKAASAGKTGDGGKAIDPDKLLPPSWQD